jgi:hypothetical protein
MPKDGDTIKAWCDKCQKETTHVYEKHGWTYDGSLANTGWKCLGCGKVK